MTIMDRPTFTVNETADYLHVSRTMAYALCSLPDFPSFRINGKVLINRAQLDEWIDKQIQADAEKKKPKGSKRVRKVHIDVDSLRKNEGHNTIREDDC